MSDYLQSRTTNENKRETSIEQPRSTYVSRARAGGPSINGQKALGTFTGDVWLDPIIMKQGVDCTAANVSFGPAARTNWHKHERGQYLRVLAGSGWVCDQHERPQRISAGDVIWCPAGGIHWHGADDESYMVHEAISFGGIEWYEAVGEEEYGKKAA